MAKILDMPKLSPTMEEGLLTTWHKKEGDAVAVDDLLAEVETDKATMEFRSFDAGTLLKLLVKDGSEVKLGQPVAILGKEGEDIGELLASIGGAGGASGGGEAATKKAKKSDDEGEAPKKSKKKKTADNPAKAEPKNEDDDAGSEDDKGDDDADDDRDEDAPDSEEADDDAGSEDDQDDDDDSEDGRDDDELDQAPAGAEGNVLSRTERPGAPRGAVKKGRVLASPYIRKLARERGVALEGLKGSGPHGRVREEDLKKSAAKPSTALARSSEGKTELAAAERKPLSPMRKTIAKRLTESKQTVPHFYLTIDVDVRKLVAFRETVNAELAQGHAKGSDTPPPKVSLNDFLIKAAAQALVRVPACNASFTADALLFHQRVDISVAVAVPDGLVTPVVRNADTKSVVAIAAEVRELASRARQKKLAPEDMQNGTFSISNLGMFGIDSFSAVINPPEGAILAVGQVRDEPIVDAGAIVPGKKLALTLSCDHRVVDGAVGAAFLAELRALLEQPLRIVTG